MLYALDKDFSGRTGVVEALRKRGIDFVVTDGLRSLTRSKGRNDDELKRAFEEAGRRRSAGATATPLSEKEAAAIIEQTRKKTLEAVEEMPDFVETRIGTLKFFDGSRDDKTTRPGRGQFSVIPMTSF